MDVDGLLWFSNVYSGFGGFLRYLVQTYSESEALLCDFFLFLISRF